MVLSNNNTGNADKAEHWAESECSGSQWDHLSNGNYVLEVKEGKEFGKMMKIFK